MNQRISRYALRGCAVVAWWAAQGGQLQNGGKRNLNWFAPASQLSKAAHAADAPPYAHASMSAIPSTFSRRCCCACAELSSMAQSYFQRLRESSTVTYESTTRAHWRMLAAGRLNRVSIDAARA